jgi:PAS domain S-box-containing protein
VQEDFFSFAEVLPDALFLMERHGKIVAANSSAHKLLGYKGGQLSGRFLAELVTEPSDKVDALLRVWARTRQAVPGSLSFRSASGAKTECRCDGGVFRQRSHARPAILLVRAMSNNGISNRFMALNRQIGELSNEIRRRVLAEADLHSQREWLKVTLSSIGDAVIAVDVEGRIAFINPAACQLTGWPEAMCIGRPLSEVFNIVNEETRQSVVSPVERVFREGVVVGLANHTALIRRDGTEVAIDDAGAPIRNDSGSIIGAVLVFRDMTERRLLERELRMKADALEQANRRKDEFIAMLSHELRNPLAPLRNCIAILEKANEQGQPVPKLIPTMQRQVNHLTRLVDDLLDVSRITTGKINLIQKPLNLNLVINRALETYQPAARSKGQRLEVQLSENAIINADETRLTQAFSNLFDNAVKYTPAGGAISVGSHVADRQAIVTIADTGIGMSEDVLPRIFDLFEQAERGLDRSQGGLGLGLALVRSLVELHGGGVTAYSAGVGKGSKFIVRLPILTTDEGTDGDAKAAAGSPQHTRRGRVLVVDDSTDAADTLRILIAAWGYEVRTAYSADAALDQLAAFKPDFAILDIGMPGQDGYTLARQLKVVTPGVVLIALSGYGMEEDRAKGRQAGFDHHLTKPGDLLSLEKILSGL